jgi:lysophospholipase L1-like esterase
MPERFWSYRTPERALELAEVCKLVAKEEGVDCIDVFTLHDGKQGIFTDGLHYNPSGYKVSAFCQKRSS